MPIRYDPPNFNGYIDKAARAARPIFRDKAREIANEFASELKRTIEGNLFHWQENEEKYKARKLKLGYSTIPLMLTTFYLDSIQVFEDHSSEKDSHGNGINEENESNKPRFYVPVLGYKNLKGFYVDVSDVLHPPSPFTKFGHQLEKIKKSGNAKELAKKKKGVKSSNSINLRRLKAMLEYGYDLKNKKGDIIGHVPARQNWVALMDRYYDDYKIGSDRWDSTYREAANQLGIALPSETSADEGEGED